MDWTDIVYWTLIVGAWWDLRAILKRGAPAKWKRRRRG